MTCRRDLRRRAVFWTAAGMHAVWAILFLLSPAATKATGPHALLDVFPNRFAASGALALCDLCLIAGGLGGRVQECISRLPWFLPTQAVLFASVVATWSAMIRQHYGDGVPRAWEFIVADQIVYTGLLVTYTWALVVGIRTGADHH